MSEQRYDLMDPMAPWTRPAPLPAPGSRARQEEGLFGPGKPVLPMAPEEAPRLFEYQPGINLVLIPRNGFGLAPFAALRNLADASKEVRLNIELIKREVRALKWKIATAKEKDPAADSYAPEIDAVQAFLDKPDGVNDFDQWTNQLVEELLVTDAVTI